MVAIIALCLLSSLITLFFVIYLSKKPKEDTSKVIDLESQVKLRDALLEQQKLEKENVLAQSKALLEKIEQHQTENLKLTAELSRWEERYRNLQEQYELAIKEKEHISDNLKNEFQEITNRLLKEREDSLEKRSSETLKPIREDLKAFKEQVEKSYIFEREQRTSLQNEIKNLIDRSQDLSKEAHQLSVALKGDSKVQGDWGEMILDSILERSGLIKGENYEIQQNIKAEDGSNLRPDVIVKYPDERFVVIDSKVSLSAYVDYVNAESDEDRNSALKRHILSVQKHIGELTSKNYCDLIAGSPDFTLMFIPNEPAYNLAMQTDPKLWETAYQKRVVLINATNLVTALRMVQDMWRRDKQIKNVDKISKKAADMYDKFVTIEESFLAVETALNSAQKHLTTSKGQLLDGRGNLKRRMEELKDIGGLQTKKQLKITEILED